MKSSNSPHVSAVLLCAGKGARAGLGYNKLLYRADGQTVLERTLDRIQSHVRHTTVVAAAEDHDRICELLQGRENIQICIGGATRTESVRKGLAALPPCDIVVIHDGARPFVGSDILEASIDSAVRSGSGIDAVPATDTIKVVDGDTVVETLDRSRLVNVQTPQTFRYNEIVDAYARCDGDYTDDSAVYERAGYTAHIVAGDSRNVKITTPEDVLRLGARGKIGSGFDVHRLVAGRKLILGGVELTHDKGLLGHSDADVLTHAIMDALLSAAGLPDIGVLFPDNDAQYKDISSLTLLARVLQEVHTRGYAIGNVSAVVMAEKPKLAAHIPAIRARLAEALETNVDCVNVSATTTEKLGIIGEEKGIAASATCLLYHEYGKHRQQ